MEHSNQDLRSLKAAAKEELGRVQGVEGVGLGEGSLRIYVRNPEVRKLLPKEFRGVPVNPVVTGEISAISTGI